MVYTNLKAKENGLHGIWESSQLLSVDVGNIYDALVRDESNMDVNVWNVGSLIVDWRFTTLNQED